MSIIQMLLAVADVTVGPPIPTIGIFYGGLISGTTGSGLRTMINSCGALVGTEASLGTPRGYVGGAPASGTAIFYGGVEPCVALYGQVTRINSSGSLIGESILVAGQTRYSTYGTALGANAVFFSGNPGGTGACGSGLVVTKINSSGALVGSQTQLTGATARACCQFGAAPVGAYALYYAGLALGGTQINTATRMNICSVLVGSQTNVGTARWNISGARIGTNGVFYGGIISGTNYNLVTRINKCGALVGSETAVGSVVFAQGSTQVNTVGVFYAGGTNVCGNNNVIRINACGTQAGSTTNVGTARIILGGAGL